MTLALNFTKWACVCGEGIRSGKGLMKGNTVYDASCGGHKSVEKIKKYIYIERDILPGKWFAKMLSSYRN